MEKFDIIVRNKLVAEKRDVNVYHQQPIRLAPTVTIRLKLNGNSALIANPS